MLEILKSPLLSATTHGFFTRKGGASSGIFEGLNCGQGSSDQREAVLINRGRVAEAMAVRPADLLSLRQVHSTRVVTAEAPWGWEERPEADGIVTRVPGLAISVLTADCAPVLFHDAGAGVIGAAHAGWRGALEGVLGETVAAMERLGATRATIRAAVGPTISQRAYEVGPEFFEQFAWEEQGFERYFIPGAGDRMRFDLPGFALGQLRALGIEAEWTGHCTYSDPARFYSYRRATHAGEPDYGRMIAAIRL
jgi:YfiH family protein